MNHCAEAMRKTWAARRQSSVQPPTDDPSCMGTGEIHPQQYAVIASQNAEKVQKYAAEACTNSKKTVKNADNSDNALEQNNHMSDVPVLKQCVEMQVPGTLTEAVKEPTAESKLAENYPDENAPAGNSIALAPVKFFIQGSFSQLHNQFGDNAGKQCVLTV